MCSMVSRPCSCDELLRFQHAQACIRAQVGHSNKIASVMGMANSPIRSLDDRPANLEPLASYACNIASV